MKLISLRLKTNGFDQDFSSDFLSFSTAMPVNNDMSATGAEVAIANLQSVLTDVLETTQSQGKADLASYEPDEADTTVAVEIDHNQGCCCMACGGNDREDEFSNPGSTTGEVIDPSVVVTAGPAGTLAELADFLTDGFWIAYGTVPREFNLTDTGLNPKSGVIHYNVTGYTNAGSAGTDINGLSAARADLVRDVLDVYSAVLGITFVETTSSDVNHVDLFFSDNQSGAYANSVGYSSGIQYSYVNIQASWSGGTSTYNDYTLQTIFHEVGHALGLGHQGLYNGTGDYATDADFANDSWQATMMSYFSQTENTALTADFAYLQTPMAVDWIALDNIYGDQSFGGTDFGIQNAFTGDTTYGFNTTITAAESQIWAEYYLYADLTASTIVDAGGIDTVDFSGYSADQLINLTVTDENSMAPSTSNIGGLIGNLTLAAGTVIENAVGGSGDDTFYGNDAANTFTGNGGDDYFYASLGGDTYNGDGGTDTISYAASTERVGARLNGTAGSWGADGDIAVGVENLIGSDYNDLLSGNGSANVIEAGDGDDSVYAQGGDDFIVGGLGADTIRGQGGRDTVSYEDATQGAGIGLDGSTGTGGAAGDVLLGVENIIGSDFDDTIIASSAANDIDGGAGNDTASYVSATSGIGIRLDGTTGWGGANGDTLTNVENLTGSDFGDTLVGNGGANRIEGGDGDDTIYGNGNNDVILGGLGADTIYGQGGTDTASYEDATQGVVVGLDGTVGTAGAAGDVLNGIENFIGSDFDDTVIASNQGNDIDGGAGSDTASYANAGSGVGIRLDGTDGWGGADNDNLTNIENLIGSGFNDTLVGDNAANVIDAGDGNDTIYANNGADMIIGGAGDDTIYGQGGNDDYIYADGFGNDTIAGFEATNDNEDLDFSALSTIASYTALTTNNHMSQSGSDVVIDDFAGNTITLLNVQLADLDQNDFIF